MFVIIGYVVALVCIFGVYILHGGNIGVILKALPFETVTILGGALGAFVVNNPPKVLKATLKMMPTAFKGSKYTKERYLELLAMMYDILQKARKEGLMAIEKITFTKDPKVAVHEADIINESVLEEVIVKTEVWKLFGEIAPEKIGKFDFRNIGSTSLLQLKKVYCNEKRCLSCAIGVKILNK